MAIDVTTLTASIGLALVAVASVGLAVTLVLGAAQAVKWCRMALGYRDVSTADLQDSVDRQNAASAAWDSGYMRRQFDASWSAEEKAAWREGVAAQHADKRSA